MHKLPSLAAAVLIRFGFRAGALSAFPP